MRTFLFGTRASELEEQILRSARGGGWETTRNSFFFFHKCSLFPISNTPVSLIPHLAVTPFPLSLPEQNS